MADAVPGRVEEARFEWREIEAMWQSKAAGQQARAIRQVTAPAPPMIRAAAPFANGQVDSPTYEQDYWVISPLC